MERKKAEIDNGNHENGIVTLETTLVATVTTVVAMFTSHLRIIIVSGMVIAIWKW
jgi:hypothetical protein